MCRVRMVWWAVGGGRGGRDQMNQGNRAIAGAPGSFVIASSSLVVVGRPLPAPPLFTALLPAATPTTIVNILHPLIPTPPSSLQLRPSS